MAWFIYFAGSIRAGRTDAGLYARIVQILKQYGTVLTEHVGDPNLTEAGEFCAPPLPKITIIAGLVIQDETFQALSS